MIYHVNHLRVVIGSARPLKWKLAVSAALITRLKAMKKKPPPNRRKPRNYHRNRGFAVNEMDILSGELFQRMFRLYRLYF
jgi:hypothetical protein